MSSKPKPDGIFVSCVSDEFEEVGAPFPGLRSRLDVYLRKANCRMYVREVFPQTAEDTVEKLDMLIRDRAAVLHLIGGMFGSVANEKAVAAYLKAVPEFLDRQPELKAALGDFSGITYTHWEAYIALHHGVPLFIYATDEGITDQSAHLKRLRLARRYPGETSISDPADLFGQLIGDIHTIVASVPKFQRRVAGTQLEKHAPKRIFGREAELFELDVAWANSALNVFTLVAWGGAGKTSLVFHWVQTRFAKKGWSGVERYFDWSFYSQGTGESRQTSADLFIHKALEFFGDLDPTKGGPHERGERLAGLIRQHRTLLILDGIEPLQYPPGDPQAGRLKDSGLEALLRELAADNPGLVVITTREHLTNLEGYATTDEQKLDRLPREAAVELLRNLQIVGTDEELHAAWRAAGGHALTLSLLGRYIADGYEDRDIRHYRDVKFETADQEHQGRSAFKVMIAYERWLQSGGPPRERELAVLRLTGLFDRPMAKRCLQVLRAEPSIPGLTDALVSLTPQQWNIAVNRLSEVELLSVSADAIDAHPLIREYFAKQLQREQQEAVRAAHSRLFDFLCENTPYRPDTLDGLTPLYEAVTHGCLAGRHQEALYKVYVDRILRGTGGDGYYSTDQLGATNADLSAVAAFFVSPWDSVASQLSEDGQAFVLHQTAYRLRSLGRLSDAERPLEKSLDIALRLAQNANIAGQKHIFQAQNKQAAIRARILGDLEMILGQLSRASAHANDAIQFADISSDGTQRMLSRSTAAKVLMESGKRDDSREMFAEAERLMTKMQPRFGLLHRVPGFHFCELLLAPVEKFAWRVMLHRSSSGPPNELVDYDQVCREVGRRAKTTLDWALELRLSLLVRALHRLTLCRVELIGGIILGQPLKSTWNIVEIAGAVTDIRAAGQLDFIPLGLLTASLYHFVRGEHAVAQKHLAEAQQIAERGPMPLLLADIHLTRARLAGSLKLGVGVAKEGGASWNIDPKVELAKAAKLIRDLGYGRRYDELADAEEVLR